MRVVFFDGHCNLCNRFVDFLIRRDTRHALRFASLQGETAKRLLPKEYVSDLSTVVFLNEGKISTHSSAALRAIATLGGGYYLFKWFLLVPAFIRNLVYRFVASNRYTWFGRRDTCRLPSPEEKAQFLD